MRRRVAIVYNEPQKSRYDQTHEQQSVNAILESVIAVHASLLELGDGVTVVSLLPPFEVARKKLADLRVDVVFNLFEGFCGDPLSEALVPEVLDEIGLCYTGCRPVVLRLALDKAKVKVLLKQANITTADFQLLNPETLHTFRLGYPCIVKPRSEDASLGISAKSVVRSFAALKRQVSLVCQDYGGSALVEEFIGGREFNATVIGYDRQKVLPISEIVYTLPPDIPRLLTFAAKWEHDSIYYDNTKVHCPAEVTPQEREYIAGTALAAVQLTGCSSYARVDMRMDESGKLHVIEINPNPDISPGTGAARQAEADGLNYTQFVNMIINTALEKVKNDRQDASRITRRQAGTDADTAEYARI